MNPNSISHRLFVAALANGTPPSKRVAARPAAKNASKAHPGKSAARAARQLSEWSWSGWQHTTI